MLTTAYLRRKRFEGRAAAAGLVFSASDGRHERVTPGAMIAAMGGLG